MNIPEVTVEQMKEIDRLVPEEFNIESMQMMENAGRLLAGIAFRELKAKRITILVGSGNNGADGLVAARYLYNMGAEVEVVLSIDSGDLNDNGIHHLDTLKILGIPIKENIEKRPDLIIDCLLGYSARGEPYGRVKELIGHAKDLSVPILSCDVPSGFDTSSGKWHEPCFRDCACLTLGLPKRFMKNNPGIMTLFLGDIGIPPEAFKSIGIDAPNLFAEKDHIKIKDYSSEEQTDEIEPEDHDANQKKEELNEDNDNGVSADKDMIEEKEDNDKEDGDIPYVLS